MNQILHIPQKKYIKYAYIVFIIIAILLMLFSIIYLYFTNNFQNQNSKLAQTMEKAYSISRLYADFSNQNNKKDSSDIPYIMGTLYIPKINLKLPVISEINDELLNVSICRFHGPKFLEPR